MPYTEIQALVCLDRFTTDIASTLRCNGQRPLTIPHVTLLIVLNETFLHGPTKGVGPPS